MFTNDGYKIKLKFPVYWQWALAKRILQEPDFVKHRAEDAVGYLALWFDEVPSSELDKQGILEFLLLSVDQWARGGSDTKFVQEVWRLVLADSHLSQEAVWFAAPKASLSAQELAVRWASKLPFDSLSSDSQLFSLMYFCAEIREEAADIPRRFALLQPFYSAIGKSLVQYFLYIARRLFPKIDTPETWIRVMSCFAGCEALNITEELAQLAVNRLIELVPSRMKSLDFILQYLAMVDPPERVTKEQWHRSLFYEWVVFSYLGYLLEHPEYRMREELQDKDDLCRTLDAREAFDLLTDVGWYDGDDLHKEVAFSIRREANIAFGFWYRTTSDSGDAQIYHELIDTLLRSGTTKDRETAFFLIRHSEPIRSRQLAVVVDSEFRPALEVIAHDSRLRSIHAKYAAFFRCNKVPLAANESK